MRLFSELKSKIISNVLQRNMGDPVVPETFKILPTGSNTLQYSLSSVFARHPSEVTALQKK